MQPMGREAAWPLPSESPRVRQLLYLSEGLILGAGGLLLGLSFAGAYLVNVRTGSFNPRLTAFGAFTLLFFLFLAVRWRATKRVSPPSKDTPAELEDWSETRKWRWVVILAIPISVVMFGGATFLWSWWEMVFLHRFDLLLLGTVLAGMLLYAYTLHKIGM